MTVVRRCGMAAGVIVGLAGAYFAGAALNRPAPTEPEIPATARSQSPESAEGVGGMTIPDQLPPAALAPAVALENPTDVLTGAAPVPVDLLRVPPPPPSPEFVIPDLPVGK
jgi:hypothetical protein